MNFDIASFLVGAGTGLAVLPLVLGVQHSRAKKRGRSGNDALLRELAESASRAPEPGPARPLPGQLRR